MVFISTTWTCHQWHAVSSIEKSLSWLSCWWLGAAEEGDAQRSRQLSLRHHRFRGSWSCCEAGEAISNLALLVSTSLTKWIYQIWSNPDNSYWKIMEDHGRSWKIMEDHGRSWKIMEDHGRWIVRLDFLGLYVCRSSCRSISDSAALKRQNNRSHVWAGCPTLVLHNCLFKRSRVQDSRLEFRLAIFGYYLVILVSFPGVWMGLVWCSVTLNLSFRCFRLKCSRPKAGGTRGTGATHRGPVRSMGSQCWRPRQVMIWLPSIVRMLRGLEIYMWIALKRTSERWRNMLCITHTCSKSLTLWATLLCTMPRCLEGLILWKRFWTFIVILTLFFISSLNSRDMKRSRVCCSRRREVHVLRLSLWCLGSLIRNMVVLGSGLETAWKRFAPNFQVTCFRGDMPKPMHVLGQIQRWRMWFVLWRTENNWNPFLWNFDFADLPWSGFLHRTPGVILKQSQEMLESNTRMTWKRIWRSWGCWERNERCWRSKWVLLTIDREVPRAWPRRPRASKGRRHLHCQHCQPCLCHLHESPRGFKLQKALLSWWRIGDLANRILYPSCLGQTKQLTEPTGLCHGKIRAHPSTVQLAWTGDRCRHRLVRILATPLRGPVVPGTGDRDRYARLIEYVYLQGRYHGAFYGVVTCCNVLYNMHGSLAQNC